MKSVLPFLAAVLIFTSCSTAYKTGQTPDDVYYSPAPKVMGSDYVQMNREDNKRYRRQMQEEAYNDAYSYYDDRYLRMKVRNRRLWSDLDFYYNAPMAYRYYDPYWGGNFWSPSSYWNAYTSWDYFYNPYFRPFGNVVVVNPKSPVYSRPRTMNLNTFNNSGFSSNNPKRSNNQYVSPGNYNRSYNQPRSLGNELRGAFGNNSGNNNSYSSPSRSSSGSYGGSSGGGSNNSGSSAPVRKF